MWRRIKKSLIGVFALWVVWLIAALSVPLPERLDMPGSLLISYQDGTPAHVFLAPDDRWRIRVSLDEIDPNYVSALLSIEDKRFEWHYGVDPFAVFRALIQNLRSGEVVSGASTITMQLVRVLEPRPRTLTSKITEAFRASQLELRLDKNEILEAYLSFVPFGKNIEGVEAASLSYFGRRAHHLDAEQIATLIAVPQNPNARYPSAQNSKRLKQARDHVARLLALQGQLSLSRGETINDAVFNRPVPKELSSFPREIPHLAMWIKQRSGQDDRIVSTIDPGIQRISEEHIASFSAQAKSWQIRNSAAVVVEKKTGEIRALVGGFDFWDNSDGAQIPAFFARRSTGSTLKPLIYALSVDQGLALPEQLLQDTPAQFGDYSPGNYDGNYDGLVSMESALSRSLNIPFVRLLRSVGLGLFVESLRKMGSFSLEAQRSSMGLSAALGVYMSPVELATVYLSLARGGLASEVSWQKGFDFSEKEEQILSRAAVWLTRRALQRRDRPDFPQRKNFTAIDPGIAWKTGTSVGHHDAWSAGWSDTHVAVVWTGNLDNEPTVRLVGSKAAAPIMFDILESISNGGNEKNEPPESLMSVEVCAYSGHIPDTSCPVRKNVLAITDRVPTRKCPYHLDVEVERESGLRVAPGCRDGRETKKIAVLRLPSAVQRWMNNHGSSLPELAQGCEEYSSVPVMDGDLQIQSPRSGQMIMLIKGVSSQHQQLALFADYPDPNSSLKWFVNGVFVGESDANQQMWWTPHAGSHRIEVRDEQGHSSKVNLEVREAWR